MISLHNFSPNMMKMLGTDGEKDESKDKDKEKGESKVIVSSDNNFLKIFTFDGKTIRTTGTSDNPWFVVKDICDVLDIKDNRVALRNIPEKWKDECKLLTLGGYQNMSIINEAGIYKLIMRSKCWKIAGICM